MRHVLIGVLCLGMAVACGSEAAAAPAQSAIAEAQTPVIVERLVIVTATPTVPAAVSSPAPSPASSPTSVPTAIAVPVPTSTPFPPLPTYTPFPTWTPAPVQEPLPTHTPYPTYTPVPTSVPEPTPEPLPTPTPQIIIVTATATATATPTPTKTPTPTPTPSPTSTPVPPDAHDFTGKGVWVSDYLWLKADRFAVVEAVASGAPGAFAASMVSPSGCVVSLFDVEVPYAGMTAFQVKAWDEPDECGDGALAAAGSILLVRTEVDVAWRLTITQHQIPNAERVPWDFEGTGSVVGVPLFLSTRQTIRVQSEGTGALSLTLLGLYKDREHSYEAFTWVGDLSSGVSSWHTGPTGVYLPVMKALPERAWRIEFRGNY